MNLILLLHDRFNVEMSYVDSQANEHPGEVVPVDLGSSAGLFRFIDSDSPDVLVKILNGKALNNHWWVFIASLTERIRVSVEDTKGGEAKQYFVDQAKPIRDTHAFRIRP